MDLLRSGVSAFASLTGFGLASPSQSQYSQSKSSQAGSIFGQRAPIGPGPSMSSQLPPAGQTPGNEDSESEDDEDDSDSASESDSDSDDEGKEGSALKSRYVTAGRKKKVKTKSGEIGW
jgi:hypothetical protein